jgi:ABC-type antimicrobial peptide transport system permease subunit
MLGGFAVLAVVLAAVGIYGVVSYTTGQRTHEIGIRMAVGAGAGDIVRTVLGSGMLPTAAGIALGMVAALLSTRLIGEMLYQIGVFDPVSVAVAATILAAVALLASLAPAARAVRVDPATLLRQE